MILIIISYELLYYFVRNMSMCQNESIKNPGWVILPGFCFYFVNVSQMPT